MIHRWGGGGTGGRCAGVQSKTREVGRKGGQAEPLAFDEVGGDVLRR